MKLIVQLLSALLVLACAVSCSHTAATPEKPLVIAEQAFADGYYARAQMLADSLIINEDSGRLGATPLCRLALLFMQLGEVSGEVESNTAMAARALEAALRCDSDSTSLFIAGLPVDDRARLILAEAVAEGSRHVPDTDASEAATDSMINTDIHDYGTE